MARQTRQRLRLWTQLIRQFNADPNKYTHQQTTQAPNQPHFHTQTIPNTSTPWSLLSTKLSKTSDQPALLLLSAFTITSSKMANLGLVAAMLLVLWLLVVSSPVALGNDCRSPSPGHKAGKECRTCIVDQLKFGCPKCVPLLRCMARCLWNGTVKAKCTKRCDCNGGKPSLGECKVCMSRCKCSCVA